MVETMQSTENDVKAGSKFTFRISAAAAYATAKIADKTMSREVEGSNSLGVYPKHGVAAVLADTFMGSFPIEVIEEETDFTPESVSIPPILFNTIVGMSMPNEFSLTVVVEKTEDAYRARIVFEEDVDSDAPTLKLDVGVECTVPCSSQFSVDMFFRDFGPKESEPLYRSVFNLDSLKDMLDLTANRDECMSNQRSVILEFVPERNVLAFKLADHAHPAQREDALPLGPVEFVITSVTTSYHNGTSDDESEGRNAFWEANRPVGYDPSVIEALDDKRRAEVEEKFRGEMDANQQLQELMKKMFGEELQA